MRHAIEGSIGAEAYRDTRDTLPPVEAEARDAYLELLKQCLTRAFVIDESRSSPHRHVAVALAFHLLAARGFVVVPDVPSLDGSAVRRVPALPGSGILARLLERRGLAIVPDSHSSRLDMTAAASASAPPGRHRLRQWRERLTRIEREFGVDWPRHAETMVGLRRLDNVQECVVDVVRQDVPGDLIEAGVWRGGTAILMRAVLAAWGASGRRVWLADSFAGLPKPFAEAYPADAGFDYSGHSQLAVSARQVRANFARYRLLDDSVMFLPGLFKDTLASAPIDQIAVMRLDGDLYESTIDALDALYPKLSVGGYCIIDDYGAISACRRAVDDYRRRHGITEAIMTVGDWTGAYWQRQTSKSAENEDRRAAETVDRAADRAELRREPRG
jgi:O-methyltransferase